MEILPSLTAELKEKLTNATDLATQESIIYQHISAIENKKFIFPQFPAGLDWFNVSEPIADSLLEGKILVLDFFTYCCINCLHIIPHLRQVEGRYSVEDGVVVIGIHCAKFDHEKNSENILLALKKYNISHPVVNDKDCLLWNKLNISCWPTILILSPQKKIIFSLVGEGNKEDLIFYVRIAVNYYKNEISSHELPLLPSDQIITTSILRFPSKITRLKNLFAVSDCGNHRILVFNENGHIKFKIGGKAPGFKDGNFEEAQFNSPQGLVFYNSTTIYIADTENHAIRLADLNSLKVTTVVGNGRQGMDFIGGKSGTNQEISSPWDVCIVPCSDVESTMSTASESVSTGELTSKTILSSQFPPPPPLPKINSSLLSAPPPPPLFPGSTNPKRDLRSNENENYSNSEVLLIVSAGTHQIWAYFIDSGIWWRGKKHKKGTCLAIAGTGKEENKNNYYANMAAFAQPSGLTYSKELKAVFVADSESSAIRKLSLKDGSVGHVAGASKAPDDLFSFGDVDGKGYEAKLQHPLAVAWSGKQNQLFVCDTYNHKIKKIQVSNGNCVSIHKNSSWFAEPSGCCFNDSENILYVCDTNNNSIKTIDLTNYAVEKFDLKEEINTLDVTALKSDWQVDSLLSTEGGTLILRIEFSPKEVHGKWKLNVDNCDVKTSILNGTLTTNVLKLVLEFPPSQTDNHFQVSFNLVLCGSETCDLKNTVLSVVLKREKTAGMAAECSVIKNLVGN